MNPTPTVPLPCTLTYSRYAANQLQHFRDEIEAAGIPVQAAYHHGYTFTYTVRWPPGMHWSRFRELQESVGHSYRDRFAVTCTAASMTF